jgi:hypothetical protein
MDRVLNQDESDFLKEKLDEALGSFAREDAEKDFRKTLAGDVESKTGIPKKLFNKMAKTFYKQSLKEEQEMLDDVTVVGEQLGYVKKEAVEETV